MRKYGVSELKGNEILAKSVYLKNGETLLREGSHIDESYKASLLELGVLEVYIKDPYESYEKPNFYLEKDSIIEFQQELEEILSHHIYGENKRLKRIKSLGERMVQNICQIENKRAVDIGERIGNLYEHIIYTTMWSLILAKENQFSKRQMEELAIGGLLHDLGLCYMNVAYQNCCFEEMNPMEIFELKKHTILAYTALEQELWIPEISKKLILFHHEKKDGSGYPLKQKNQETECRMIQICDTLDGILCGMERKRRSLSEAIMEIENQDRYDEKMAEVLKNKIARYPVGTRMELEDGQSAIVVSQTEDPFHPEVIHIF